MEDVSFNLNRGERFIGDFSSGGVAPRIERQGNRIS
jgi:hypothetical protein